MAEQATTSKRQARRDAMRAQVEEEFRVALRPLMVLRTPPDRDAVEVAMSAKLASLRRRFPGWRFLARLDHATHRVSVDVERMKE